MSDKEIIRKLFKIAQTQQKAIRKLAGLSDMAYEDNVDLNPEMPTSSLLPTKDKMKGSPKSVAPFSTQRNVGPGNDIQENKKSLQYDGPQGVKNVLDFVCKTTPADPVNGKFTFNRIQSSVKYFDDSETAELTANIFTSKEYPELYVNKIKSEFAQNLALALKAGTVRAVGGTPLKPVDVNEIHVNLVVN